jgi:CubicO group peptidase (beta-lactamase class C family)
LSTDDPTTYFPPPESAGGWRTPPHGETALDPAALETARAWNAAHGVPTALVVIHRGALAAEFYEHGATPETTFNVYSCSKSFTGTAYGILFGERADASPALPAYPLIPAGYPLTDPRKAEITLRHLLSMSSGIPGESIGVYGVRVPEGADPFEAALGHAPVLARDSGEEVSVARLAGEPGTVWDYCDPAFAHLTLAFSELAGQRLAGQRLAHFMAERVFAPIGLESVSWDAMGVAGSRTGVHTMPYSGVHITAREFARFGYLMLRGGVWQGRQLVPASWIAAATAPSQPMNPGYGLTWWTNAAGALWPGVPRDAYAAMGYNCNLCCVIPSRDLVIVRIGLGPTESTEVIAAPLLRALAGT